MKRIDTAQIRIDHYRCIDNGQQWGPLTAELSGNTYLTSRMRKLGHFFWENALVSRVTLVCSLRVLGLYRVVYKPRNYSSQSESMANANTSGHGLYWSKIRPCIGQYRVAPTGPGRSRRSLKVCVLCFLSPGQLIYRQSRSPKTWGAWGYMWLVWCRSA